MTDQRQAENQASIPCPFRDGGARGWKAWINAMPGAEAKLIVVGEVEAGAGYTGQLTIGHTDKMKPPTQFIELKMVEKAGAPAGWREVRAEGKAIESGYRAVVILCHGEELARIEDVPVVE